MKKNVLGSEDYENKWNRLTADLDLNIVVFRKASTWEPVSQNVSLGKSCPSWTFSLDFGIWVK